MDPKSFHQVTVDKEVMGEAAAYLGENMEVSISMYNEIPIAVELPPRAVVEVVETEPVMKGQSASGSFKPALLSNGVRTMVPTHILPGARIVVLTEDGSYVERAKD
jgi:elongation factor P